MEISITQGIPKSMVFDPKGWRGTIGLIIPSKLSYHPEYETRYLLPEGVGLVCQRLLFNTDIPLAEALRAMHNSLPEAAHILSLSEANIISFDCTSSSFLEGKEFELRLVKKMEKASSLPAMCAAGAVADALKFMGVKKVLVISPYTDDVTNQLVRYLREDHHIGIHFVYRVALEDRMLNPWQQFKIVLDAYQASPSGADAIFFSCGGTRLVEVIPLLETETGLFVANTNLCNTWKCLRMLKVSSPIYGQGKLFERPR